MSSTSDIIRPEESINRFYDYLSANPKERLVQNINYLISIFDQDPNNMRYTAVELNVAMERFGISNVCHIAIDTDCGYKLRLYYTGEQETKEEEI